MSAADVPDGWERKEMPTGRVHIMPVMDVRPHEPADMCWCGPKRDNLDPMVWTHRDAAKRGDLE